MVTVVLPEPFGPAITRRTGLILSLVRFTRVEFGLCLDLQFGDAGAHFH